MISKIGIISDTHGILRPVAVAALDGVDYIIHAGDAGKPEVLADLEKIAPVFAVRGNVDRGEWAAVLPVTRVVQAGDILLYVLHNLSDLDLDPGAAGFAAVISGHSHRPVIENRRGILYLNPGSAGPQRFHLPVSLVLLTIQDDHLNPQLINLE